MYIRSVMLAALLSASLALWRGLSTSEPRFLAIVALLALGFLAVMSTRRMAAPKVIVWTRFWLLLVLLFWLWETTMYLYAESASLVGLGPAVLGLMQPYLISSSLMWGCWRLTDRALRDAKPSAAALLLMWPFWVALGVCLNPAGALLSSLPLLASIGLPLWLIRSWLERGEPYGLVWNEAVASVVEMAALQAVAWGATLSVARFSLELSGAGLFSALFVALGTGLGAWLLSGLLWGLAQSLRCGRPSLQRAAGLLFGVVSAEDVQQNAEKPLGSGFSA